jgi:hypothetical protein
MGWKQNWRGSIEDNISDIEEQYQEDIGIGGMYNQKLFDLYSGNVKDTQAELRPEIQKVFGAVRANRGSDTNTGMGWNNLTTYGDTLMSESFEQLSQRQSQSADAIQNLITSDINTYKTEIANLMRDYTLTAESSYFTEENPYDYSFFDDTDLFDY